MLNRFWIQNTCNKYKENYLLYLFLVVNKCLKFSISLPLNIRIRSYQRYPTLSQSGQGMQTQVDPLMDGTEHTSHSDYVQSKLWKELFNLFHSSHGEDSTKIC